MSRRFESQSSKEGSPHGRRTFLSQVAKAMLGVSVVGGRGEGVARVFAAERERPSRVHRIIVIFAEGGMSHLDSFDPKEDGAYQGPVAPIATATPGVRFGGTFSRLAARSERLAVVRSMTTETADHAQGRYLMRTSYKQIASIRHPSLGSTVLDTIGPSGGSLPGYIIVGGSVDHPGRGFLGTNLAPMPVPDPEFGPRNMKLLSNVTPQDFNLRLRLADRFDRAFKKRYDDRQIDTYDAFYREAVRLMGSEDIKAFDLQNESRETRESYGMTREGQGCLLARRLCESGVPFVEVESLDWDGHSEWFRELPKKAGSLDMAIAALLDDLESRGLLDSTLVAVMTEFGRSPKINSTGGRDHHPGAFSCLLAGAGIKPGVVHGATDETGLSVESDPVSVADLHTTIVAAAGLPYGREYHAPNGRPFKLGGDGSPIAGVLA